MHVKKNSVEINSSRYHSKSIRRHETNKTAVNHFLLAMDGHKPLFIGKWMSVNQCFVGKWMAVNHFVLANG
jgi:hypothetical protein